MQDGPAYLFVYGTLRAGSSHRLARRLASGARHLGLARAPGRLHDLGPYPAMIAPAGPGEWVHGDLFELDMPGTTLPELDRYEGCSHGAASLFDRVRTEVVRPDGQRLVCWVYLYAKPVGAAPRIHSGDYR